MWGAPWGIGAEHRGQTARRTVLREQHLIYRRLSTAPLVWVRQPVTGTSLARGVSNLVPLGAGGGRAELPAGLSGACVAPLPPLLCLSTLGLALALTA